MHRQRDSPHIKYKRETRWLKRDISPFHHKAGMRVLVGIWRAAGSAQRQNLAVMSKLTFNCTPHERNMRVQKSRLVSYLSLTAAQLGLQLPRTTALLPSFSLATRNITSQSVACYNHRPYDRATYSSCINVACYRTIQVKGLLTNTLLEMLTITTATQAACKPANATWLEPYVNSSPGHSSKATAAPASPWVECTVLARPYMRNIHHTTGSSFHVFTSTKKQAKE
eukprot:1149414-Pelagomonas_calceolata.AAC.2